MSYPMNFQLADTKGQMHLRAGEGFLLVEEFEVEQATGSGIILSMEAGGKGEKRAVVLDIGPSRGGSSIEVKNFCPFKPGDVVLFAAGQGRGLFDPGLDRAITCVGQANVMSYVPRKVWDPNFLGEDSLAAEYRGSLD